MKNIWPKLKRSMGTSALAMVVGLAALLPAPASAQAPKDAAAPPSSAAPAAPQAIEEGRPRTVVENPYGIEALWKQGDFVSRGTLIILVIMSIGSWYIGIVKLIEQARLLKDAREADQKFWAAKGVQAGVEALRSDSAFRFISEE